MKNLEENKTVVINRRFVRINFTLLIGVLFIIFALITDNDPNNDDNFFAYAVIALILIFLLIGWILCPICCVVNSKSIKIVYAFGKNTFTNFKHIRKIYIDFDMGNRSFFKRYNYVFDGLKLNKKYMTNEFMKCKKLEKALLLYAKDKLNNKKPE